MDPSRYSFQAESHMLRNWSPPAAVVGAGVLAAVTALVMEAVDPTNYIPAGRAAKGAVNAAEAGVDALKAAGKAADGAKAAQNAAEGVVKRADDVVPESGAYTIEFQSGMKYHGKGPPQRADASAKRVGAASNDKVATVEHTPKPNATEAFKEEARRISADGGPGKGNYNKIESPGKKLLEKDGG